MLYIKEATPKYKAVHTNFNTFSVTGKFKIEPLTIVLLTPEMKSFAEKYDEFQSRRRVSGDEQIR